MAIAALQTMSNLLSTITLEAPSSTCISLLSLHLYHDHDKLLILFRNGSLYEYQDSETSFMGLFSDAIEVIEKGGSIGSFFNQHKAKLQNYKRL